MKIDHPFEGFEPANTTPVPDVLFDELLADLSEAELKVLLYIIRRTSGFKKPTDAISLTQFQKGIKKRATGEILDRGCGVKDRATIIKALASLEKKRCIVATRANDPSGDKAISTYRILFRAEVVGTANHPVPLGSGHSQPPWWAQPTTVVGEPNHGVVGTANLQETVIQETALQETDLQEGESAIAPPAHSTLHAEISLSEEEVFAQGTDAGADDTEERRVVSSSRDGYENETHSQEGSSDDDTRYSRPGDLLRHHPHRVAGGVSSDKDAVASPEMAVAQQTSSALSHGAAPAESGQASDGAASAGALPPNTSTAPRASGRKRARDQDMSIPDEAVAIMDAWDSLFKHAQPRTEKHERAAIALMSSHPSRDDLKACKDWLFTTDNPNKPWFRKKGVSLQDVADNYTAWQSVAPDEEAEPEEYTTAWFAKYYPEKLVGYQPRLHA